MACSTTRRAFVAKSWSLLNGYARYDYAMEQNERNSDILSLVELHAFRLPLAAAVASKLGVFSFEPMSEEDLRDAIRTKDTTCLSLMDDYFQNFAEWSKSPSVETIKARDEAS